MKKIAVIGTQGVPAKYGGFESLVDNIIGGNRSDDVEYTVFCSSLDLDRHLKEHKGSRLKYVPLHANGIQSIPYDVISMMRALKGFDAMLILGVSGCLFLPLIRLMSGKTRIAVNIDGMEHRREKWGPMARNFLRSSEAMAVKYADVVIADNKGIQDYVKRAYNRPSTLITYGGDHVIRNISEENELEILKNYGVSPKQYAMTVCRIEPENNCHLTLEAASRSKMPLLFIGNWGHSEYSRNLRKQYADCPTIMMRDAIYDLDVLFALRKNAGFYVHGHSAGGTNTSLVEAMFFGIPILAFDVEYNRYTTFGKAFYWQNPDQLVDLLERSGLNGEEMATLARENYIWKRIARQYEEAVLGSRR